MNYIKIFYLFFFDIIKNRSLLINLAENDFKTRYLGNYLGILWAFIQPTITILIFWFVFQMGFKSAPVDNFPFILWLMSGMVPWFFFADSLQSATNSILSNSFLVKKVVFRVSLLPMVQIISALIVHVFFISVTVIMFILYGRSPSLYWLQIVYYLFATIIFVLGLSWFTSSVIIFFRDLGQIISMTLQFGFWLTPIFWSIKLIPLKYQYLIKANPVYYLVEGYRDSLIYHVWFWERPVLTIYYWIIVGLFFFIGIAVFNKLRPYFADVI